MKSFDCNAWPYDARRYAVGGGRADITAKSRCFLFVCLFDLILYVPSTIFQLCRDGSSWVKPVLSMDNFFLLKDHNAVTPVRLQLVALRSRVKHSTFEPLRSL